MKDVDAVTNDLAREIFGVCAGQADMPELLAVAGAKRVGIIIENGIYHAINDLQAGSRRVDPWWLQGLLPDNRAGPSIQFDHMVVACHVDVFRWRWSYNWRGGRMWLRRFRIHEPEISS